MLRLSTLHAAQIRADVLAQVPHETCGLLAGVGGDVRAVYPVPNVAPDPSRSFLMDAQSQVAAMLDIMKRRWNLLAIYHSHPPGSRSDPSPVDVAHAAYPEALMVIAVPDED